MEQEQILSTLTAQLGQTSLSERTISEYVNENLPAEGEEFNFERHAKILRSLNGNFSADMKLAVEGFKKNYKPETKPADKGNNGKPEGETDVEKRLAMLEKEVKESRAREARAGVMSEVAAMGKTLKVANKELWEDAVKTVEVGENDNTESVTAKAKKAYEKLLKRYFGDGATPYGSSGRTGASKVSDEAAKAEREKLRKEFKSCGKL